MTSSRLVEPMGALERWLRLHEHRLKTTALWLGIASTVAIVQDWHPWPMVLGLPFCVIWMLCGWLHGERQLKWINVVFAALYVYGLARWALLT